MDHDTWQIEEQEKMDYEEEEKDREKAGLNK